jgi:hypothetical protein
MQNTKMVRPLLFVSLVFGLLISTSKLVAGTTNYKNLLVGDRAAGMGGAFIALSDDPSGIYYNPAGIVFASEKYLIQASSSYISSEVRYANVFTGRDYVYKSEGLTPNFFGVTQSLGSVKFGFALIVPQDEALEQDDQFDNVFINSDLSSWSRRYLREDRTILLGPAFAFDLMDNLSMGVSLFGSFRNERFIDNQTRRSLTTVNAFNIRTDSYTRQSFGFLPKVGIQFMPAPQFALGLTVSKSIAVSSNGRRRIQEKCNDATVSQCNTQVVVIDAEMPKSNLSPFVLGAGAAYFFNKSALIASDIEFYTPQDLGQDGFYDYSVQPVLNWSIGTEIYLADSFALRGGFFTNFANTPRLVLGRVNQPDNVDVYGGSFSLALGRPGKSISLGAIYSQGQGEGQATPAYSSNFVNSFFPYGIQAVTYRTVGVYMMASYEL